MKTPPAVPAWHPPPWVTVHNAELAAGALVVILLAFAVLRLSKGSKVPPPAPAPEKPGGGGRLLLLAAAAAGGFVLYERHVNAAAGAKAAPAPSPSPSPSPAPAVTRTLAPHPVTHITLPHLTGGQIVLVILIGAVVAVVLLGPVLRKRGD